MISGPRCEAATSSDRHVQPRRRVAGEHDRVQRRRDIAGERRIVGLGAVRHVVRVSRGLGVLLRCGPVDRRHWQVHHVQARIAGGVRIDSADRHREHESIADARVLAITDDSGAVVEEHAEQRDRLGKRRCRTGEPRRCGQQKGTGIFFTDFRTKKIPVPFFSCMQDFRVICRTERVKQKAACTPWHCRRRRRRACLAEARSEGVPDTAPKLPHTSRSEGVLKTC